MSWATYQQSLDNMGFLLQVKQQMSKAPALAGATMTVSQIPSPSAHGKQG